MTISDAQKRFDKEMRERRKRGRNCVLKTQARLYVGKSERKILANVLEKEAILIERKWL